MQAALSSVLKSPDRGADSDSSDAADSDSEARSAVGGAVLDSAVDAFSRRNSQASVNAKVVEGASLEREAPPHTPVAMLLLPMLLLPMLLPMLLLPMLLLLAAATTGWRGQWMQR